jgi:molybdenum cofactor cytidylyltransferase
VAAAVVPAAGRSERFGSMKLLADVEGEPLLNHTLRALVEAGITKIVVVLAPGASLEPAAGLRHPAVRQVVNPDPSRGMFSSIQRGLAEAGAATTLVLPADMPFVRAGTVRQVARASDESRRVVVPAYRGRRGHPVAIPGRLVASLLASDPSATLKDALAAAAEEALQIEVEDEGVVRDVDTTEDLNRGV